MTRCDHEFADTKHCIKCGWVPQTNKTWRTLVRVESPNSHDFCIVTIPIWDPDIRVKIDLGSVPDYIRPLLVPGKRLHAQVNVGARTAEDLKFSDWEVE